MKQLSKEEWLTLKASVAAIIKRRMVDTQSVCS